MIFSREKGTHQESRFPSLPNLQIGEAEGIQFRNADRLVGCVDQNDAMIVFVVSP